MWSAVRWGIAAAAVIAACVVAAVIVALVFSIEAKNAAAKQPPCKSGCDPDPVPDPDPKPCGACPGLTCEKDACTFDRPLRVRGTVSAKSAVEDNGDELIAVPVYGDNFGLRQPVAWRDGSGWARIGGVPGEGGTFNMLTQNFSRGHVGLDDEFYAWGLCSRGLNATAPEKGPARARCKILP